MAAAVRALGLLSPHRWGLGGGEGASAGSGMGRHSWLDPQHCGAVRAVLTRQDQRELAGGGWSLRSFAMHMSGLNSEGQTWRGSQVPGKCRWLP